ncbi:ATP-binding protein [Spirochaeta dissipatitropha]
MTQTITATYKRLLASTSCELHRYLYPEFNLHNRLTGLIGPRGTGKTTLMLQYIKEQITDIDSCIYASLDHIYFAQHGLIDFVHEQYETNGVRYFFLDEIHKYQNWNQELKNIYDSYPDISIVFSGSSSIDLIHGSHDLSRRSVLLQMHGLSFREYLWFRGIARIDPISYDDLLQHASRYEQHIGGINKLRGHFRDYLQHGYYPFFMEDIASYSQKLFRVIEKTIYEDIPNYYRLKTENLIYFKKILAYVASIPPGELNRNSISRNIGLDNRTVQTYLSIMEDSGLLSLIASEKSGSNALKQREKIFLENPNLYQAVMNNTGYQAHTGSIREIFFLNMLRNSGHRVFYSTIGDFCVNGTWFEIGGRNKSTKQIQEQLGQAYLVKDDILYGSKYEIPLYLFGFLY